MKKQSELGNRVVSGSQLSAKENTTLAMLAAAGPDNANSPVVKKLVGSLSGEARAVAVEILKQGPLVAAEADNSRNRQAHAHVIRNVETATRFRAWGSGEEKYFVERRADGEYSVRKPGAQRPIKIVPTKAEAMHIARSSRSGPATSTEHVRSTSSEKPSKWRKR